MKYFSFNNLPPVIDNKSGKKIKDIMSPKLMENGNKELVKKGTRNWYAQIQSHKASQDINYILDRAKQNVVNYNSYSEEFYDLTKVPDNLIEAHKIIETAKDSFNILPVQIKNYFGNNPLSMLKAYDSGKMPEVISQLFGRQEPFVPDVPKAPINQQANNVQGVNNNE